MTNTETRAPKVELTYTNEHGQTVVLARNTLHEPSWDFWCDKHLSLIPWTILRGISYLAFKVGCAKIPIDPDFIPGLAAAAAYHAAQRPSVINNVMSGPTEGTTLVSSAIRKELIKKGGPRS